MGSRDIPVSLVQTKKKSESTINHHYEKAIEYHLQFYYLRTLSSSVKVQSSVKMVKMQYH
jgi:hypothetical protein